MDSLLRASGIQLNSLQLQQLWTYHNLLRKRNQDRELTRLIGFETIIIKHYVDCMIVGELFPLPSPLLDLGTGAGFPGIPLKIRYPHLKLILAEPKPRRIAFLEEVCREIPLKHIEIFQHRVTSRSFQVPMKAVITRAVEPMEKTLLRTSGCLDHQGILLFMKGPNANPEIEQVKKRFPSEFHLIVDHFYRLPHTSHERRLVILKKNQPSKPV